MEQPPVMVGPGPIVQPAPPPALYVTFSAEVIPQTSEALIAIMGEAASAQIPEVHLLLSTPGGSVMNGINVYNVLRAMPFKLITHNVGNVDSIGNPIFLAGEERYACPHSTFMFHGVGFDINGQMRLEEKALKERLDGLRADQKRISAIVAERSTLTDDDVHGFYLDSKTMDADEALESGLVHEIRDADIPAGSPVRSLVF